MSLGNIVEDYKDEQFYFAASFSLRLTLSIDQYTLIRFRAYGAVYKAMHKETGQVVAIKQVPVDTDLQEIIKEISMMQQCDRFGFVNYSQLFSYSAPDISAAPNGLSLRDNTE